MFFNKKKEEAECFSCNSRIEGKFSFCPYCGTDLIDREREMRDFGLLGKSDSSEEIMMPGNFGITDKIINSLVNSLVKNLDRQFKEVDKNLEKEFGRTEVRSFPNGIKIKIGPPVERSKSARTIVKKALTSEQLEKMSSLPRAEAKSSVKRLNNKVVYELSTPGVDSPQDIFVSKLESGYEIKAIGSKKIYVNSLPVNLPLKRLSLAKNKLLVEFHTEE